MISRTGTNISSFILFGLNACALNSISFPIYLSGYSNASTYHTPKSISSITILSCLISYGRSSSDGGIICPSGLSKSTSATGFCTFTAKKKAAKEGRNPRTGETVKIPVSTDQVEFATGLDRYCYCYELQVDDADEQENILANIEAQLATKEIENTIKRKESFGFEGNKFWWKPQTTDKEKNYILTGMR